MHTFIDANSSVNLENNAKTLLYNQIYVYYNLKEKKIRVPLNDSEIDHANNYRLHRESDGAGYYKTDIDSQRENGFKQAVNIR